MTNLKCNIHHEDICTLPYKPVFYQHFHQSHTLYLQSYPNHHQTELLCDYDNPLAHHIISANTFSFYTLQSSCKICFSLNFFLLRILSSCFLNEHLYFHFGRNSDKIEIDLHPTVQVLISILHRHNILFYLLYFLFLSCHTNHSYKSSTIFVVSLISILHYDLQYQNNQTKILFHQPVRRPLPTPCNIAKSTH